MQSLDFSAELFPIILTETVSLIVEAASLQPQTSNFVHIHPKPIEIPEVSEDH